VNFSKPSIASKRILLIGKTTQHCAQITRFLSRQKYAVHTAENIDDALNGFETIKTDLVLIDLYSISPKACVSYPRLKSQLKTRNIPMIFISHTNTEEERIKAFSCGANDYISTPIIDRELQARLATHLVTREHQLWQYRPAKAQSTKYDAQPHELLEKMAGRKIEKPALREHSALINCLFEASTIGVVFWRRDGTLIDANDTFLRTLGLSHEQIREKQINWLQLVVPEERESAARRLAQLVRGKHYLPYEKLCRGVDGRVVPILVGSAHLEGDEDVGVSFMLDLSKQRRMENELLESRQQLRDLAAHVETARENERKRIAREIHDGLGSHLAAMKMEISLLSMETREPSQEFQHRLLSMQHILDDTVRTTRQIASELRPAVLNHGLSAAVEWLADNFRQRSSIACCIEINGEIPLDDVRATALFRIIQESLTNIARHARANEVTIEIAQQDDMLKLAIADDGCGFDPAAIGHQSFGLLGISERLEALSGNLIIASSPGYGTTLHITIPIKECAP
jgi:PAS domain S-box-containing protein